MRILLVLVVVVLLMSASCRREMDSCESFAGECKDSCVKDEEVRLKGAECEDGKACCFKNFR